MSFTDSRHGEVDMLQYLYAAPKRLAAAVVDLHKRDNSCIFKLLGLSGLRGAGKKYDCPDIIHRSSNFQRRTNDQWRKVHTKGSTKMTRPSRSSQRAGCERELRDEVENEMRRDFARVEGTHVYH